MTTKNIIIKTLTLKDFKGVKALTVHLDEKMNKILGDNATGKTTISDAFAWLLFDKDTTGRSDFAIKPFDKQGNPIHNLESIVESWIMVNKDTINLKKIYREKWVKPRGSAEAVFSGHETVYYYNDVPLNQKDYQAKIQDICQENIFKLLTNPLYFPRLNWQDQRRILTQVAGDVSYEEIAKKNPAYTSLLTVLNNHKSLDEYKREISAKKKKIREQLDVIPARIDEVQKGLPEEQDWSNLESVRFMVMKDIEVIDVAITDAGKGLENENEKRTELQKDIYSLIAKRTWIENEAENHIQRLKNDAENKKTAHNQEVKRINEAIGLHQRANHGFELELDDLRSKRKNMFAEWKKINAETYQYEEIEGGCPYCGQPLPEDFINADKASYLTKFNEAKAGRLATNVAKGKEVATSIKEIEQKIQLNSEDISENETKMANLSQNTPEPDYDNERTLFLDKKEYNPLCGQIIQMQSDLEKLGPAKVADTSELQEKRKLMRDKLTQLNTNLHAHEQIMVGHKRIEELKKDQQFLSQELANLEKEEYAISGFQKEHIEAVESRINSKFRLVKFRMFESQVNGGEQETCECMIEGVPYSDLNHAGQINAGMDIVSVLQDSFGIRGPVWVDNKEAINDLLPIDSQQINLIVTTDKQLIFN